MIKSINEYEVQYQGNPAQLLESYHPAELRSNPNQIYIIQINTIPAEEWGFYVAKRSVGLKK